MKNHFYLLLTFTILSALSVSLSAQSGAFMPQRPGMPAAKTANIAGRPNSHKQPRAVSSKLLSWGFSKYISTYYLRTDSGVYSYSNGRVFNPTSSDWEFDTAYNFVYDTSITTWRYNYRYIQTFDANNFDTLYQEQKWDTASGLWKNQALVHYQYTGAGKLSTYLYQSWNTGSSSWVNSDKYVYSYNGSNQETQYLYLYWNGGASRWDTGGIAFFAYDGSGNQTVENFLNWNPTAARWDSSYRYLSSFDLMHDQTSQLEQNYDTATRSWSNGFMYADSGFVATMPLMEIDMNWNGSTMKFDTIERWIYSYTPDNHYLTYFTQNYNSGTFVTSPGNYWERYHYQEDTTTGIAAIAPAGELKLYPVPAQDMLNVDLCWGESQAGSLYIFDATGRKYGEWPLPEGTGYEVSIPLSTLPGGLYTLQVKGEKGSLSKAFSVRK